jgi:hypothetical protein
MTRWLALSDMERPPSLPAGLLTSGSIALEVSLPLSGPTVLLDYRCQLGWARALSIFADPATGVRIFHRQGAQTQRHDLPALFDTSSPSARIVLTWDAPARSWKISLSFAGSENVVEQTGFDPLPIPYEDIVRLCAFPGDARRNAAVLWFGVSDGSADPECVPWVGLRTPVATPTGWVHAASLRAGDLVLTVDHGAQPVMRATQVTLPARGSFAPVLLRAPYFADECDILVSADQHLLLQGSEIEYLFGEESVLAEARYLADGTAVVQESRRNQVTGVMLELPQPELIRTTGCAFAVSSARGRGEALPRRGLHSYEYAPLLALRAKGGAVRAA